MKILIPMAGIGNRFVQAGYTDPKPLIRVNGRRIIEYILDLFEPDDEIHFICNETHLAETNMRQVLSELRSDAQILEIKNHKKGPIYTIMPFIERVKNDEPVLVCYCDNPFLWDKKHFVKYVKENNLDGCILTHSGMHPHTLNSTKMAFLKTEKNVMLEIKEKECYTNNPMNEHASTGAYYFRTGALMKQCFEDVINKNINYNGEYYVTLAYNSLVNEGARIGYYDTEFVTVFGTPQEVESFEAWVTILNSGQVRSEQDLIECYRYWRKYHDKTSKI